MTKVVLLDANPLSQIVHPKVEPKVKQWVQSLQTNSVDLRIPEIADYEVRRELIRAGKGKSIKRLDQITQLCLIPISYETMRIAAELWALVRNQGKPTASNNSLDGDVILAAQAILLLTIFDEVLVVTTNYKHISLFENKGIQVEDWQQTLNNLVYVN